MIEKVGDIDHFLNNISTCIPGRVYWKDIKGVYKGCNLMMGETLGLPQSKIIGKTDFDFIDIFGTKENVEHYAKIEKNIVKTRIPQINIDGPSLYLSNGTTINQITNKVPLFDGDDNLIGVLSISIDVTERKKAEEFLHEANEKRLGFFSDLSKEVFGNSAPSYNTPEEYTEAVYHYLENIISHMPGNIYWTDKNSVYLGCNENVTKMLGLKSHKDILGITYEDMARLGGWTEGQGESFKKDDQEVMRTNKPKLNVEEPPITNAEGKTVYYLTSRVPLHDKNEQITGILGISVDITDIKKAQFAIAEAKERAETANKAKTEFMENMSHDFKTPLNGIYGVVQILRVREDLPDDLKDLVVAQEKAVLRLKNMVESILDFNKLAAGKIQIHEEPLNLFEIIESIVDNLSFQVRGKELDVLIKYPTNIPRYLLGDSYCVTSIILNLMSNAVKFTDKGNVTIEVKALSQKNENITLKILVKDTGTGIPADKLDQIFERFHRLELSNKGKKEGHGIGLAIVKELVGKINGKIEVKSKLGIGSTFTLTLPFKIQNMNFSNSD